MKKKTTKILLSAAMVTLLVAASAMFNWLAREPFKMAAAVIISTFICAACFVWIQRSGDPVSTQKTEE